MNASTNKTETFIFVYDVRIYKEITYEEFEKTYPLENPRQVWETMLQKAKKQGDDEYVMLQDYESGFDCDGAGTLGDLHALCEETQGKIDEIVKEITE
jgi:hypothetical protein